MQICCKSEERFDGHIKYLNSRHCNKVVSTASVEVFVSLLSAAKYLVVKDCEGLAVAYYVDDTVYIRGKEK